MVGHAAGYFLVFFGGGLGAMLRHFMNLACARGFGTAFPWGTFIINITGSTVMGLIAGYLAFMGEASQQWRLFITTGILGGYTTFSAFSLDAVLLYERGELDLAALYVADRWRCRSAACSRASRWCAISPETRCSATAICLCRNRAWPPPTCAWISLSFRLLRFCDGTKQGK